MAPTYSLPGSRSADLTANEFREQWIRPADVFSVLLLLGGDIVARALAQLAGHGLAPVTFSFGWVAYSLSALSSAVGENKLMPQSPDCQCRVITGGSGTVIDNSSWIIGRIVRDFEIWSHKETKLKTSEILKAKWDELKRDNKNAPKPVRAGLVVTVYEPSQTEPAGSPKPDMIYWSGLFTMAIQMGISSVPYGVSGHWGPLLIAACGSSLALLTGLLPQWKREKWACRKFSHSDYILTRGNGAQHAIIIRGNGHGLNLADLATGQSNLDTSTNDMTRIAVLALAILWVSLLVTAAGTRADTAFLLAIGGLGMLQNVFAAGWVRRPESFGIPLEFVQVLGNHKVMETLFQVERAYPGLGLIMKDEFFPENLRPDEITMWQSLQQDKGVTTENEVDGGESSVCQVLAVDDKRRHTT